MKTLNNKANNFTDNSNNKKVIFSEKKPIKEFLNLENTLLKSKNPEVSQRKISESKLRNNKRNSKINEKNNVSSKN